MALPDDWIAEIFRRLTIVYGERFVSQWPGIKRETVSREWARQLDGITSGGIAHALDNLPHDFPPNPMQFRALCNRRPLPVYRALPAPKERASEEVRAKVACVVNRARKAPKQWAHDLKAREEAGAKLSPIQARMWREALRPPTFSAGTQEPSIGAGFQPVPMPVPQTVPQTPVEPTVSTTSNKS